MPYPYESTDRQVDKSPRFFTSSATVAQPATAAETVICQITGIDTQLPVATGVFLSGVVSMTIGTAGTAARVRIRTGTAAGAGTVIADTGNLTGGVSAANLISQDIQGTDTTSTVGAGIATAAYCLTLTVPNASATSAISGVNLAAFVN